ncbi:hypothetical protein Tco_0752621 [Tanacetum coccineum]|uniref:Uncharacterized protein n=1 Tax=Tanacetum coccineum TaxID=301880 RepID=A0ABQ4ZAM8_9ASTR
MLLPNVPQWSIRTSSGSFKALLFPLTPFPSTDEPEKRPLKEFLIKFSALNGQRPLTLDFHTFCSSTSLDSNNGKYVAHPAPEVVKKELGKIAINPSYQDKTSILKNSFLVAWRILFTFVIQVLGGNYSSTEQFNSIQQLLAYSLITGTEVDIGEIIYSDLVTKLLNKSRLNIRLQTLDLSHDSVSPPPLVAKPKKGKSQTLASTLLKSQGLEASEALSKKRKQPKSKRSPTETKESPPKPTEVRYGLLSHNSIEGTHQSKPLPEGTATHPKDSGGNKQPLDRDITSTTSNKGTAKTTPRPEGSLRDKDSGGNILNVDMEPIHTSCKTSSEVDPDTEPLKLQTYADIQAFLLSDDELDKDSDEEEVLAAGDDMDENP